MKKILLLLALLLCIIDVVAEETISTFYEKIIPQKKMLRLSYSSVDEVEALLVETTNIKDGTYEVSVSRVDSHIYKIDGTDLYIEMPYCFEYSFQQDAMLKVKSYMGHKTGVLVFLD